LKVLVTGATGFIGQALVRKLVARGDDVRALVRSKAKGAVLGLQSGETVEGDITDPAAVERAVRGTEVVYHIAGSFRDAKLPDCRYREVNVDAVRLLIEAASRNDVRRIVHCGTCGIHGNIQGPPADETYPIRPVGIYEETKAAGEKIAFETGRDSGIEVTALRPGPVYGPGDTRLLKLFKLANRDPTVLIGSGTAGYHLVYIDDLTDAFILAGRSAAAPGEAFLIGGPEIPSLNELVKMVAAINGRKLRRIVRLPARPMWLAGWACEMMCRPLGIEPPIFRRRVDFFINNRAYDIGKARALLGYAPRVHMREGLERTAAWYRGNSLL
jgi:nucleoside-diphosphate-sugar epimerase